MTCSANPSADASDGYRVEISGWGLDNDFFVEKTELVWNSAEKKTAQLHRALPEGAIVFVRLLPSESRNCNVPIAYSVGGVEPMDRDGLCRISLTQLHPRSKQSLSAKSASKCTEGSETACDMLGRGQVPECEEILE